jgi:hypothetical protein
LKINDNYSQVEDDKKTEPLKTGEGYQAGNFWDA